jgi:hypothetical protein
MAFSLGEIAAEEAIGWAAAEGASEAALADAAAAGTATAGTAGATQTTWAALQSAATSMALSYTVSRIFGSKSD